MANSVATTGGTGGLTDNEKYLSAVGYVWICCALPLFLAPMFGAKDSRFAKYHAKQAAALYIVAIGATILLLVVETVLAIGGSMVGVPAIAYCGTVVRIFVGLACFVLMIIGAINAMQGTEKELPGLGALAAKLPF